MTDKQIIIDGVDVKDCKRRIGKDNFCRYYKRPCTENNYNCIWKKYLRKEQECEEKDKGIKLLLEKLDLSNNRKQDCEIHWEKERKELKQQLDQLKTELKSAKELREYTYDCCKQAGEELAKNSFEWDGKEKNLIVQAMELNERYDQLKEQLEAYKMEAEEGKEINAELKAENYYLKRKISQYENLLKLDFTKCRTAEEEVEHANYLREQGAVILTEENHKLKETLAEIKEIADEMLQTKIPFCTIHEKIIEKISEVESEHF